MNDKPAAGMFVLYEFEQDYDISTFNLICASPDKDKIETKKKELEDKAVDWNQRYKEYKEREGKFYKEQVRTVVDWLEENRDAILEVSKTQPNWTRQSLRDYDKYHQFYTTITGSGASEFYVKELPYSTYYDRFTSESESIRYLCREEPPELVRRKDWHNDDGTPYHPDFVKDKQSEFTLNKARADRLWDYQIRDFIDEEKVKALLPTLEEYPEKWTEEIPYRGELGIQEVEVIN